MKVKENKQLILKLASVSILTLLATSCDHYDTRGRMFCELNPDHIHQLLWV